MTRRLLTAGARLGRYEVRSILGAGAMADVYLARDLDAGREVALKVLSPGPGVPERRRRFEREARAASSTRHPNIVSVFEAGVQDRLPFIAMEYVAGKTLRQLLRERSFDSKVAAGIGAQLAEGLQAAHDAGIVHRDLKPDNVIIANDGVAKILDFGLSKPVWTPMVPADAAVTDEVLTLPGTILGTLDYMSPEQASGYTVDFRSDQFSLGAILYEMMTGIVPFARDTVPRTLAAIIEGRPNGLSVFQERVPQGLRAIVEKTLAKRPDDRYASMHELATALRRTPFRRFVNGLRSRCESLVGLAR